MNTENNFAHFYTELSLNPDLPTRRALQTAHRNPPRLQITSANAARLPLPRSLPEEVKSGLTESMRDFQVVEFEDDAEQPRQKSGCWKIPKRNATTAGR